VAFLGCEVPYRFRCHVEKRIAGCARYIILNLGDERWDKIESLVDARELLQQLHHSVIVFESVQTNPRKTVFAGNQIFIKRLMLVPKNYDAKNRHLTQIPLETSNVSS
jgi:hypothetical protein